MTNTIKLLSPDLINKIAAGEVVERPASIVKELIENSIDAGADKIILKIENGGINYIEVVDNGTGMSEEDAKLALVQHATSKIHSVDDLKNIYTLGFRGEALASISSVSKLKIHTKSSKEKPIIASTNGERIIVAPGDARNQGTTVIVENIFDQIPARRKFLKSELTEYKNILNTFTKIVLPHYQIGFEFYNNSKLVHSLPKVDTLEKRILQIHPNLIEKLIPLSFDDKGLRISGFVGHPVFNRRDSSIQYIFVNNRSVMDPVIAKAVKSGFGTNLMHNQYPIYFINIKIDEEKVDVNVHPRKNEIRFDNTKEIFRVVHNSVRNALEKYLKEETFSRFHTEKTDTNIDTNQFNQSEKSREAHSAQNFKTVISSQNTQTSISFTRNILLASNNISQEPELFEIESEILQIFNTYLVIQNGDSVQFIDQHAADERINFEKIEKRFKEESTLPSQKLLLPEILNISKSEQLMLLENKDLLYKLGFEFKIKGNKTELTSIPEGVYSNNNDKIFSEILASLDESSDTVDKEENSVLKKLIATIACHSSIRAGQKLDNYQARQIFRELLKCSQPYSCPHGRPIIWIINKSDLEKNFKRKQ
ncbi:MAG TPA: DNA mismatch repair endonuclease MutL [Candidatus Dojkabacteria bacterium]|nr:DNA mismatch repair endonuclease MutL [Candidatus Dojkabacteria bacterium]